MNDANRLNLELKQLVGSEVLRPQGTLAGHAAGLPFERLVHQKLLECFPNRVFRHYEFLNRVLDESAHQELPGRLLALGPPSLQKLLSRGKEQMKSWSPQTLFEEKQNDTAESIIQERPAYDPTKDHLLLLDVKTYNEAKAGQPPNIISAGKVAETMLLALSEGSVRFDIIYVGVSWIEVNGKLKATNVYPISLFKMKPQVYINWAAAEQIQFHPHSALQNYAGSREEWAAEFLSHFTDSLQKRIDKQVTRVSKFRSSTGSQSGH